MDFSCCQMDGIHLTDPFLWDVNTVTNELCSLSRPCTRNLEILAAKLQENEIDGHTLLTYDLVGLANAHELRNELFQILNIQLARHKNALGEAIMKLRVKSPGFRQWKLDNLELGGHEDRDMHSRGREGTYSTQMTPQSEFYPPWTAPSNDTNKIFSPTPPPAQAIDAGSATHTPALSALVADARKIYNKSADLLAPTTETASGPRPASPIADLNPPVQGLKRKRVAPELIQENPINALPVPIATEADTLSGVVGGLDSTFPWDTADNFAYLGPGAMARSDVKSHAVTLTDQIQGDGDLLCTPAPTRFPPGRRLTVHKVMRQVLVKNGRTIALADAGVNMNDARQSSSEPDKILELDDLPEDIDDETLREMEAEKAEMAQKAQNIDGTKFSKRLSLDRVQQILDEEISNMTDHWTQNKKPKYQNKAYSLWIKAYKKDDKRNQILEALRIAKFFDERIKKMETRILEQTWDRESHVRAQARSLEQTVEDKLHMCWVAETLESRAPPPKPISLPKRSAKRPKPPATELSEEEILTSSEDESFIVNDDESLPPSTPIREGHPAIPIQLNRTPSPFQADSPVYIDLTQTSSTRASSPVKRAIKATDRVDLATPTKLRLDNTPTIKQETSAEESSKQEQTSFWMEKYTDIEKIVNTPISRWTREKERFALTITLLWRMSHRRRTAIFKHAKDCDVQESFKRTILSHISSPLKDLDRLNSESPESLAFDMSRLFLCFLKAKNLKESRLADLKPAQIHKLKERENHSSWNVFHAFLTRIAPFFPQDSQIYREEALDDEILGDDASNEEASLLDPNAKRKPPRKNAPKEIVRNKEAVDLREREIRRQEEQEARRRRVRANLGGSGLISSDKSRLIINESKQDDQAFIYINEEIGHRIKDHQIEGVRFMWDQIVQDLELRQGCLLAHSMGLGKTMQVITLLVAIQESSKSADPRVVSQIPEDLRQSKTLVACPPGLVNNWMDELMTWDKDLILGDLHTIEAESPREERVNILQKWSRTGGVLVIGYAMLRKMAALKEDESATLFDEPNIIVADEAHNLKNPASKIHLACCKFRTGSRIAMTGSPLANNIEEYYFMIDWVAPKFLGPLSEFREIYSNPIQHGVDPDSTGAEKRRALKKLEALKQIVAPKVHRATIKSCMNKDLPPKQEFVICVKPKPLQVMLYNLYAQLLRGESVGHIGDEGTFRSSVFRITNDLGLLCNHPHGLYEKAREILDSPKEKSKPRASLPDSVIAAVMTALDGTRAKSPSLSTKVELLIQILDDAKKLGDKVLVFSQSIPTLDYLTGLFREQKRHFSRLDGTTPIPKRQDQIKKFNTNQTEVYLISTKAGGVGLNIQGANKVVIFDFGWNPVHEQQAIGRSYRIGQTKPVSVYHFVTAGSFEQDLHGRTVFKSQLATRVVDKKNPISWGKRVADLKHDMKDVKKEPLTQFLKRDRILDEIISYSGQHDVICKVMSTDTFEEEDNKAPLTVEEQKEADDLAALNKLRSTNYEEFTRKQRELEEREFRHDIALQANALHSSVDYGVVSDVRRTLDGTVDDLRNPTTWSQLQELQAQYRAPTTVPLRSATSALPQSGNTNGVCYQNASVISHTKFACREHICRSQSFCQYPGPIHILARKPLNHRSQRLHKHRYRNVLCPYLRIQRRRARLIPSLPRIRIQASRSLSKSCEISWKPFPEISLHI